MENYLVKPFTGNMNNLKKNQSFYDLYIPSEDLDGTLSSDEVGNLCGFDSKDEIQHAEDGKKYVKFRKYFLIGEEVKILTQVNEVIDLLSGIFDEDYEFNYLIVVFNYLSEIFDKMDLGELSRFDEIDRHKGHIRFYTNLVRIKSSNILGTRLKLEYLEKELVDLQG